MLSGIDLDRFDRLCRAEWFPYDRFRSFTVVQVVRIEVSSAQATEVVPVAQSFAIVRVVFPYDRPSRLNSFETSGTTEMDRDDPDDFTKTRL